MPSERLPIIYFSDVLCVWAYAAQARLDELYRKLGDRVSIEYRFLNIYGDVQRRILERGEGSDPRAHYARGIHAVAKRFAHTKIHPDVFTKVVPRTGNQAHAVLGAVRELIAQGEIDDPAGDRIASLSRRIRLAFFEEAQDVGATDVLLRILSEEGVPTAPVERSLRDGTALAELGRDLLTSDAMKVEGSPTYVLDGGREKLFGNVGYRIIEANVTELLGSRGGSHGASWC